MTVNRQHLWPTTIYTFKIEDGIDNEILYGMGNILYKTVYIYEYWDNGNKKFVGSEIIGPLMFNIAILLAEALSPCK